LKDIQDLKPGFWWTVAVLIESAGLMYQGFKNLGYRLYCFRFFHLSSVIVVYVVNSALIRTKNQTKRIYSTINEIVRKESFY
jgi:hypothetical protein